MKLIKKGIEIGSVGDWYRLASPRGKQKQWKDYRSAKELARYWTEQPRTHALEPLQALLQTVGGVEFETAEPEVPFRIDRLSGEPPNCDLIILGRSLLSKFCMHVEAKADEPFDKQIGKRLAHLRQSSSVPARIEMLGRHLFGRAVDEHVQSLHYQLLYGSYATYLNCKNTSSPVGFFIVHQFQSKHLSKTKCLQNAAAWRRFLRTFPELANQECTDGQLIGPVRFAADSVDHSAIKMYFGKITTVLV